MEGRAVQMKEGEKARSHKFHSRMWFVLSTLNHPASLQPVDGETNMGQTVDGTDPDDMPPVYQRRWGRQKRCQTA